ncbi:MAG: hypothetical protein NC300_04865 [Bacteroidales bacterium]|nr:hypothetical protein [Clostridium sp.]MCM1203453.1 hypothetical protein [Bacteroidales bacterium]
MNAQTQTKVVIPVLAVLATPKYNRRQQKQQTEKRTKKRETFDSLFHAACDTEDDMLLLNYPGCYGKDAKPVVGIVSSFNRSM